MPAVKEILKEHKLLSVKEKLKECTLLVLCKDELFFQKGNGDTITTWYPVGKETASVVSAYFKIPLSYDGGPDVDNEEVINKAFREDNAE